MIIMRLDGGLGNQLFQYGLGCQLAVKHKTELKLDTQWFGTVKDRFYELDEFTISARTASFQEIGQLKGYVPMRLRKLLHLKNPKTFITEKSPEFHPQILEIGPNAYLQGCWQSEKYFADIASILRQELTLKAAPVGLNAEILQEIAATDSVSLHVRRGDYVSNAAVNRSHGTCSLEYYEQAVANIAQKVSGPHFFIFSDDPEWTRQNLRLNHPATYVTNNSLTPREDLRLMSACQHFIIANSSFSWWGAWLGENPKKIVIAPKTWFKGGMENPDLVPKSWIRI